VLPDKIDERKRQLFKLIFAANGEISKRTFRKGALERAAN
jgi:hypothetical protein